MATKMMEWSLVFSVYFLRTFQICSEQGPVSGPEISSIVVSSPLSQLTSLRPVRGMVSTAQPSSREEVLDAGPGSKHDQRLFCVMYRVLPSPSCNPFWVSDFKILRPQKNGLRALFVPNFASSGDMTSPTPDEQCPAGRGIPKTGST